MFLLIKEAIATAKSQPVASAVSTLVVMGMVLTLMLTTGRTVGSEQAILETIDSAGTRSIVFTTEPDAGVTSDVLSRLRPITGIEWAGGFSSAIDATNSAVPDGQRLPVRDVYTYDFEVLGISGSFPANERLAWASQTALELLGLPDSVGSITLTNGISYGVAGSSIVPEFLSQFERTILIPNPAERQQETLSILVVIAENHMLINAVSDTVISLLDAEDPTKITIQTSEDLADLRQLIGNQLGSYSRGLVVVLLLLTASMLSILLYGLVMLRRRDFGRRRALGATRSFIIGLLVTQTAILTLIGTVLGIIISATLLSISQDPLPGTSFVLGLSVLTMMSTLVAAVIPALIASSRDPMTELRVP